MASLKLNVAANYAGQIYTAAINVIVLPIQVRILGTEAYGLVGFFAVLSGWLQLLDVGLGSTLARETAAYRAGTLAVNQFRRLLHVVDRFFIVVGVCVAAGVGAFSGAISRYWLHGAGISPSVVTQVVALMGVTFALRWQTTPSRSVLLGLERQVLVNAIGVGAATLRSVGVLPVLLWVDRSPKAFFIFQALVAAMELLATRVAMRRSLPLPGTVSEGDGLAPLRRIASFSLRVAASGAVWVAVTQVDKLLLSKVLPLAEFGMFSMAVTAASGVSMLAGPVAQAVQPRLSYFASTSDESALRETYADCTQLVSAFAMTGAVVAAACAKQLLWVWTGDESLSTRLAPIFEFYVLGNGLLALVSMTYYLQIAKGDLRLHLRGNVAFAVIIVPAIAVATWKAGVVGAAVAWFCANLLFLLVWSGVVHRTFLPGMHGRWLVFDALVPCAVGVCPALAATCLPWSSFSRVEAAALLVLAGGASLIGALATTRPLRRAVRAWGALA